VRYVVTTPYGTFKRMSTRAYRFLVISCGREEAILRRWHAHRERYLLPGQLAAALEANADVIAKQRGKVAGWCSRRDLADALARRARKAGCLNVHIYAATSTAPYLVNQEVA